ncbi:type II secretion system F family protein [Amycolatopsis sp. cg13]|uniref:type II secretion system F family protein n=1 Tax=Amycolatopsis sp. cg13 TaxID=3238807 RepID=UPI00352367E1
MTGMWAVVFGVAVFLAIGCAGIAFLPVLRPSRVERSRAFPVVLWQRLSAMVSLRKAVVAVAAGVIVWWTTGWPVAAILSVAAVAAVPVLVGGHDEQRLIARLDALAAWVRRLADLLASGAGGLEQAIISSARTAPAPLAVEIETLVARLRTRSLEAALRGFADHVGDEAADEVVLTLILRVRAGGRGLVDILDATATAMEREAVARRDVEADRAKPRTDVRAILGITVVLLAGLFVFASDFLTPFDDVLGQLVMAGIGVLFGAAGWWMHMLTRTHRPSRLLGADSRTPAAPRRTAVATARGQAA